MKISNDIKQPQNVEELQLENQRLLGELEIAYTNMEKILEEANEEKEIAYAELQQKFDSMQNLYSELSKKENLMIHMEKLSSIGQFITELIHELSSPLTAIILQSQLAALKEVKEETKEQFNNISEYAKKMQNLLSRFKAMAYKGKEDFTQFDLQANVKECVETIEIIKPKYMRIETDYYNNKMPVKGDPYQTNQVFLNLAKNAFDAMEKHGKVLTVITQKISTKDISENDVLSDLYCQDKEEWQNILDQNSQFALVEFADCGSGIPPNILQNIFQPFFTTKERGKGTGLGLAISKDIAVRHGGNLAVKSQPGVGTIFQFVVPIIE